MQDRQSGENSSRQISTSISGGTLGANAGVNYSESHGSNSTLKTNSISKLIATDDITGNLDNLNLKGGQVYVADEAGTQKAMNLTTKTLTLTNLKDSDQAKQDGHSVGVNSNLNGQQNAFRNQNSNSGPNSPTSLPEIGSSQYGISQSGHSKEWDVQNVIGNGLTITGQTTGTGTQTTDSNQAIRLTKDESRGGYNANIRSNDIQSGMDFATGGFSGVVTGNGTVAQRLNDMSGLSQTGKAASRIEARFQDTKKAKVPG